MNKRLKSDLNGAALYIAGAGGHGREVAWVSRCVLSAGTPIAFVVDHTDYDLGALDEGPVVLLSNLNPNPGSKYVSAVGDAVLRRRLSVGMESLAVSAATIVHPNALLSSSVVLGDGVVVFPGSILSVNVKVGRHVHINLMCSVSHDVTIGAFSTLSPGVRVAGNVHIGEGVFIGAGAVVVNGTSISPLVIGDGAVIAAGACVTGSVGAGALMAGVPATRKR